MRINNGEGMSEYKLTGVIVPCPDCKGFFIVGMEYGGVKMCPTCHGKGTVIQEIEGEKP